MTPAGHLRLLLLAVGIWLAFWVVGLPDYYQQYSFTWLAVGSALILVPVVWMGLRTLRRSRPERRLTKSVWLSVYMTVPFLVLDVCYCGIYLGHGVAYLTRFWYLTIYYVIPWLVFVPIALRLDGRDARS